MCHHRSKAWTGTKICHLHTLWWWCARCCWWRTDRRSCSLGDKSPWNKTITHTEQVSPLSSCRDLMLQPTASLFGAVYLVCSISSLSSVCLIRVMSFELVFTPKNITESPANCEVINCSESLLYEPTTPKDKVCWELWVKRRLTTKWCPQRCLNLTIPPVIEAGIRSLCSW